MIFLDSSFLIALEIETDTNHEKATMIMEKIINKNFGNPVISDYIFDETITVTFRKTKNLEKAVTLGTNLLNSSEMLKIDEADFENAWKLFESQKNARFSFTDCTNLVLMKRTNMINIATFDEEFGKIKEINAIG